MVNLVLLLSLAISFAAEKHKNQFDKAGKPYILHVLKVMHYLKTDDIELMCIAVLHDVVEDQNVSYNELREMGFTERIIEGIRCMTKVNGETAEEYEIKVMSNIDSVRVKLCDLRHNSDIRRLKGVTEKDIKRTVKYQKFYLKLENHLKALLSVSGIITDKGIHDHEHF